MSVAMTDPPRAADEQQESLREVAARMADQVPGYRVEIIEGALIVSPSPTFKHNGIISDVMLEIARQLPDESAPIQVTSVEASDGGGDNADYCIPDLMVVPAEVKRQDGWILSGDEVDLAVEVVSPRSATLDRVIKPREYAAWGIPVYLVVDPRDGTLVVHSDPRKGEYQAVHRMEFGDTVELPEPLKGITITTSEFPHYDQ